MCLKIILDVFCNIVGGILAGVFFKLIDERNKLQELVVILINLKNEYQYNSIHRGNEQSPFQIYWLEKALSNLDFHNQCENIAKKSLEIFELAKDANNGQLNRRKMVPGQVQSKMEEIASNIEEILPKLKNRTRMFKYIWWWFNRKR